jgi:cytochrome b
MWDLVFSVLILWGLFAGVPFGLFFLQYAGTLGYKISHFLAGVICLGLGSGTLGFSVFIFAETNQTLAYVKCKLSTRNCLSDTPLNSGDSILLHMFAWAITVCISLALTYGGWELISKAFSKHEPKKNVF